MTRKKQIIGLFLDRAGVWESIEEQEESSQRMIPAW